MRNQYNSANLIRMPYKQIDDYQIFATLVRSPYIMQQESNIAEAIIIATRFYKIDYRKWKSQVPTFQTWLNFKHFFYYLYMCTRIATDYSTT